MPHPLIKGKVVDPEGRCIHWHSALDIVAIKFACCREYYACYECHRECADHEAERWPQQSFDTEAVILCGFCQAGMTVTQYMQSDSRCLYCRSAFNPACSRHWKLYFQLDTAG